MFLCISIHNFLYKYLFSYTENIHNIHNIPYYIIFIPLPIIIECDLLRVYHIELRLFTAYYSLVIDIYF